jgi:hypothetical protein
MTHHREVLTIEVVSARLESDVTDRGVGELVQQALEASTSGPLLLALAHVSSRDDDVSE